jgi:phosphoribosylaminoimidazole-succinocarboxamide synthase
MGSVKDLIIIKPAEADKLGLGRFTFSDRYSVFDWGEMPDHIDGKGASLCITSAYFFEKLESLGVKTHYKGIIENGQTKRLADLKTPQNSMEIKLVRVIMPGIVSLRGAQHNGATKQSPEYKCVKEIATAPSGPRNDAYDYSVFKKEKANFLIPLEVIYRNSLPEGASVFKRLKDGTLKLEDIGLKEMPAPGIKLSKPLFDVSTKLESTDRYLTWDEAREITGLANDELEKLRSNVLDIDSLLTKEVLKAGLSNEDGKVEFGFDENREMVLLDTVGTLDECRFTFDGMPVSKEILRVYYRGSAWHNEVEAAKKSGGVEWKKLVKGKPENLPSDMKNLASQLYKAACNEITGREWFENVPSIGKILGEIAR